MVVSMLLDADIRMAGHLGMIFVCEYVIQTMRGRNSGLREIVVAGVGEGRVMVGEFCRLRGGKSLRRDVSANAWPFATNIVQGSSARANETC